MNFREKLDLVVTRNNSLVCVGLDSEIAKMPPHIQSMEDPQFEFNKSIIDATADLVCAYKPNIAFYELFGARGITSLLKTIEYIPKNIPIVLDAKRGDIGDTSYMYAKSYFETFGVDAVTIHGYMGSDTVAPFMKYEDKAIFVLVKTSNPSAVEFEDMELKDGKKLYIKVAEKIAEWNELYPGLCGTVVGATFPADLKPIRVILPDVPFLVPGLGKQGGDTEQTVLNGMDARGRGLLINSARAIIFAGNGLDFAQKAREETLKLRDKINQYRKG